MYKKSYHETNSESKICNTRLLIKIASILKMFSGILILIAYYQDKAPVFDWWESVARHPFQSAE